MHAIVQAGHAVRDARHEVAHELAVLPYLRPLHPGRAGLRETTAVVSAPVENRAGVVHFRVGRRPPREVDQPRAVDLHPLGTQRVGAERGGGIVATRREVVLNPEESVIVLRVGVGEEVKIGGQPEQADVPRALSADRDLRVLGREHARVHPRLAGGVEPFDLAVVREVRRRTPEEAHLVAVGDPRARDREHRRRRVCRHLAEEVNVRPRGDRRPPVGRVRHRVEDALVVRARERHRHLREADVDRINRERGAERQRVCGGLHATAVLRVGSDLRTCREGTVPLDRAERPLRTVVERRHAVLDARHVVVFQRAVLAQLRPVDRAFALLADRCVAVVLPREERQRARGRRGQACRIERVVADAVDVRPLRVDPVHVRRGSARCGRRVAARPEETEKVVGRRRGHRRIAEKIALPGNAERRHVARMIRLHADVAVRVRHEARVDVRAGGRHPERLEPSIVGRHVGHEVEPHEAGLRAPRRRDRERLLRLGGGHRAHVDRLARVRDGVPDVAWRPRGDERLRAVARLSRRDREDRRARRAVAGRHRHRARERRNGDRRQHKRQNESRPEMRSSLLKPRSFLHLFVSSIPQKTRRPRRCPRRR